MTRRRRRKSKPKRKPRSSSGFGIFLLGAIVGASSTLLYQGVMSDHPADIGSGIQGLITAATEKQKEAPAEAVVQEPPSLGEQLKYNYHDMLTNANFPSINLGRDELAEAEPKPTETFAEPAQTIAEPIETQPVNTQHVNINPQPEQSEYVLQVGSYKNFQQADRLKATLALHGIESYIQQSTVKDKGDYYRVRVGPYTQIAAMRRDEERLGQLGYHPIRYKLKSHS